MADVAVMMMLMMFPPPLFDVLAGCPVNTSMLVRLSQHNAMPCNVTGCVVNIVQTKIAP